MTRRILAWSKDFGPVLQRRCSDFISSWNRAIGPGLKFDSG